MPALPPAEDPFKEFAQCGARLLLIGGHAMITYGSPRLTQDCDCAVVAGDEELVAEVLRPLGYLFKERFPVFVRYAHLGQRRPIVDVMLLNPATFEKLQRESREVVLSGVRLRTPKPLHLVALKLHALKQDPTREWKDWEDIKFLLDSKRDEWTREELSELAERYASALILSRLREQGYL